MHATESIITIDCGWVDCFAFTIGGEHGALFELHIDINDALNADEMIKAQIALNNLVLIVLHHTDVVDPLGDDT